MQNHDCQSHIGSMMYGRFSQTKLVRTMRLLEHYNKVPFCISDFDLFIFGSFEVGTIKSGSSNSKKNKLSGDFLISIENI